MKNSDILELKQKLKELQKKLKRVGSIMRGSVIIVVKKQTAIFSNEQNKGCLFWDKKANITGEHIGNYRGVLEVIYK